MTVSGGSVSPGASGVGVGTTDGGGAVDGDGDGGVGDGETEPDGVGDGVGEVVATVHDLVAGVGSMLPAVSRARTVNVCPPSARPLYAWGDEQGPKEAPSRAHSNVAASVAVNSNVAELDATVPLGPDVIVVSGGVLSTTQVRLAGVGSGAPAPSIALTWKLCAPSPSPV